MIYQLKITLKGIKPPIWRRIEVPAVTSLEDFHKIIQSTMGWYNGHLHHFIVGNEYFNPPSPDDWDDFGKDYTGMKISDLLQDEGDQIEYEYDFGDSWLHRINFERIVSKEKGVKYPRCVKGKRACPPEDCGGIWGYSELLEVMKDKKNPEREEMIEWLGGELDPELFDLEKVNDKLGKKGYGVYSY